MKSLFQNSLKAAVLAGFVATASLASAQSETTTTTSSTTSAGTVSEFNPSVITVRSTTSASPVSYSYSKTTTYVDESGNPVSMDVVKSGVPVTVYYSQDGDKMVASKVVVNKSTSTTTTDGGTMSETKKTTSTTTDAGTVDQTKKTSTSTTTTTPAP